MAETYHSDRSGYSISLPKDWVRVPDDVFQAALGSFTIAAKSGFVPEVGFQYRGDPWFEGPFAGVSVFHTGDQMSEAQIIELVTKMTGVRSEQIDDVNKKLTPLARLKTPHRVQFDRASPSFVFELQTEVGGEEWIETTYCFFGRRSVVMLAFLDRPDRGTAAAEAVLANSFQLDPAYKYDNRLRFRWANYLGTAIGLVIVVELQRALRKVFRRRRNRGPETK